MAKEYSLSKALADVEHPVSLPNGTSLIGTDSEGAYVAECHRTGEYFQSMNGQDWFLAE